MFICQISARSLTHAAPWAEQREKWSVSVPTFKEYMKFNGRLCASTYHIRATYTIQWWSNLVWRSVGVGALRIQTSQSPEQWGFHKVETWRVGLDKQENVCSRANNYVMGSWRDLSVWPCPSVGNLWETMVKGSHSRKLEMIKTWFSKWRS